MTATGCRPDLSFTVLGGDDEKNFADRGVVDAARGHRLGRFLLHVLRYFRGVSLVQHDVSVMRSNLLAGVAVLLMATSAAHAEDLDWERLHAETVALYGECDLDLSIAGRERLRVISHCTKDGRTTFAADDYLRYTEYKNQQLHPEGIKICPRPVRVDNVERVDRRTFTVFTRCEETGEARGAVFQLEGDTINIYSNKNF